MQEARERGEEEVKAPPEADAVAGEDGVEEVAEAREDDGGGVGEGGAVTGGGDGDLGEETVDAPLVDGGGVSVEYGLDAVCCETEVLEG